MTLQEFLDGNRGRINDKTTVVERKIERKIERKKGKKTEYDICLKTQLEQWRLYGWNPVKQQTVPRSLEVVEEAEAAEEPANEEPEKKTAPKVAKPTAKRGRPAKK
jgi:hypothetical protein